MPTKQGQYVITTVQLRPDQQRALAQLVWDHVYPSISAIVREQIDVFLLQNSDNLTHVSSLNEREEGVGTPT